MTPLSLLPHLTLAAAFAAPAQDWRAAALARVDSIGSEGSPGVAVAIVVAGEEPWTRTVGLADVAKDTPIDASTRFYLASLSKPFTALCAVRAARAGHLDLDAPLTETFPELAGRAGAATLRDCLHHRSGVPDIYDAAIGTDLGQRAVASNAVAVATLSKLPRTSFTGQGRTIYSNSGYVLLAEAVRRATGAELSAFAREHVFDPAGMAHARYSNDRDGRPKGYRPGAEGWTEDDFDTGLTGPGGLEASLDDLVAFDAALRGGALGSAELRAAMFTAPAPPHHPVLGPYAAGWMLQTIGGHAVQRHFGGSSAHSADLVRFVDLGVTIIVLSNRTDVGADDLSLELARLVLGERFVESGRPETIALGPERRAAFGRFWREPVSRRPYVLSARGDEFELISLGDVRVRVAPVAPDRLEAVGAQAPLAVAFASGRLSIVREGAEPEVLEPVPFPPEERPDTAAAAGRWRCEGVDAVVELRDTGGGLALVQNDPLLRLPPFHALGAGWFLCDAGAALLFEHDEDGLPVSFWMDTNRARGLRFVRTD